MRYTTDSHSPAVRDSRPAAASTLRRSDRILGFLLAVGVLAMVFMLRSCRGVDTGPATTIPAVDAVRSACATMRAQAHVAAAPR